MPLDVLCIITATVAALDPGNISQLRESLHRTYEFSPTCNEPITNIFV